MLSIIQWFPLKLTKVLFWPPTHLPHCTPRPTSWDSPPTRVAGLAEKLFLVEFESSEPLFWLWAGLTRGQKSEWPEAETFWFPTVPRCLLTANYYCFVPSLDCRLWGWREKGSGWPQVQVEPDFGSGGKVEMRRSTSGKAEPASPPTNFGKKGKNLKMRKKHFLQNKETRRRFFIIKS